MTICVELNVCKCVAALPITSQVNDKMFLYLNNAKEERHAGAEGQIAVLKVPFRSLHTRDGVVHLLHVTNGGIILVGVMPDLYDEHDQ